MIDLRRLPVLAAILFSCFPSLAQSLDQAPVSIGVLVDMQSAMSSNGGEGEAVAAQMAIDDFGGKILGRKILLRSADHQSKPDVGSALARQWYSSGVDYILVGSNSAVGLAVNQLALENNKLMVLTDAITDRLVEEDCNGHGMTWLWSAYSIINITASAPTKAGTKIWYTLGVDNVGGRTWDDMMKKIVEPAGAKVISGFHPLGESDYSAYLVQARASGANALLLTNAGPTLISELKQVREFQIAKSMQIFLHTAFISDVHSAGLEVFSGTEFATPWYWDLSDRTRDFGKRYFAKKGAMPTMAQAAAYSATLHYLRAVQASNSLDAAKVFAEMQALPVNDAFAEDGHVWPNGRMVKPMYRVQVKKPSESNYPWDYYKVLATVPADAAYEPLSASRCPRLKKG